MVSTADVAPTLLELLGLDPLPETDGVGLRALLERGPEGERGVFARISPELGASGQSAVREGSWKLLREVDGSEALHDLAGAGEEVDLAEEQREISTRLSSRLEDWLAEQDARLATDQQIPEEVKDKLRGLGYLD